MPTDPPLRYPAHYPPTTWRHRFFIGVRWLGPDLGFFKQLACQQGSRSPTTMDQWGGGVRQHVAAEIGVILAHRLRWGSTYFLPDDSVAVVFGGPDFGVIDVDLDVDDALSEIAETLAVKLPTHFWQQHTTATMAGLVDGLVAVAAANKPPNPANVWR